jgi:hypothetical protein
MKVFVATVVLVFFFSSPAFAKKQRVCEQNSGPVQNYEVCLNRFASEQWEYALLAIHAYKGIGLTPYSGLTLPPNFRPSSIPQPVLDFEAKGFDYRIFSKIESDMETETIIAYRGSDDLRDWVLTNFVGIREQHRAAMAVFDAVRAQTENVSVVGDSLGGGLATRVSQCRMVKRKLVLNTSPRFGGKTCDNGPNVSRENFDVSFAIEEQGQPLNIASNWRDPGQKYLKLNCERRISRFEQHSGIALAACLTLYASNVSPAAEQYVRVHCDAFDAIADDEEFNKALNSRLDQLCPSRVVSTNLGR